MEDAQVDFVGQLIKDELAKEPWLSPEF